MTENPAARHYSKQQAGSLTTGDQLLLPDGERTAEILQVEFEPDDFGTPAVVLATLTGGGTIRIAAGSSVKILNTTVVDTTHDAEVPLPLAVVPSEEVEAAPEAPAVVVPPLPPIPPAVSGPSAEELARIPAPKGTPEAVVAAAAEAHPDDVGVLLLADKLAKGINFKSGSCLKDLSDLAHELFITLKDPDGVHSPWRTCSTSCRSTATPAGGRRWRRRWRCPATSAGRTAKRNAPRSMKSCCARRKPRRRTPSRHG